MLRHLSFPTRTGLGALALYLLSPGSSFAEGFGTPTLDGQLGAGDIAIYNAAEAADPVDPPQNNAPMDLGTLYVANDTNFWYFLFTINTNISGGSNWGKYMLFVDTTNDGTGAPNDSSSTWNRDIQFQAPHQPEYSLRSWVDATPYGTEDTQWHSWNGTNWVDTGLPADGAALVAASTSGIEWKVAKSKLGDPATIWCEVISTGGGSGDPAQDTINDPADDWNAVNWVDTAVIDVSTQVARQAGTDTTPPTVSDGCVAFFLGSPGVRNRVDITFNEPVDAASAGTAGNYTDLGGKSVLSAVVTGITTVRLTLNGHYGFGGCEQIRVTGVKDAALNTIVDNGSTNVANFYLLQVYMKGRMSIHMMADPESVHEFAWEGSLAPLTWDPTCDVPLSDVDGDSTWTETLNFCLPCSSGTGGAEVTQMQYKFTHGCLEYESLPGNHFYTFDVSAQPDGVDTLDIWWNDEAPTNFTASDVDVVFRVRSAGADPPFGSGDSLAVAGSELPLTWNSGPPDNLMADDGVAPDETAADGIYTERLTFPSGTLKNVQFKYLLNAAADSVYQFECSGGSNRSVFLNDSLFSTTNPIVMDVAYYDDCAGVTGIEDLLDAIADGLLDAGRPNPFGTQTVISYSLPAPGPVRLDVYDVRGRLVRTLVDEVRPEGRHHVAWNGRATDGAALPNGVYFYRLRAAGAAESRKLVLLR
jgi:hypothetical protein